MEHNLSPEVISLLRMDVHQKITASQLAGLLMTNTMYMAFSYYQDQKGEPLTSEEKANIHQRVLNEVGKYTKIYTEIICPYGEE